MRTSLFKAVFLMASLLAVPAWAGSFTVGHLDGSTPNGFPFGWTYSLYPGTRYQQAYAAQDFAGLGPISIHSIDFFLTYPGTLGASTYSLYFSTISAGIDTLSNSDFNSNRGADNALFATVTLSGAAPPVLTFTGTPFTYDPAAGNLLLDIIVSPGGQNGTAGFAANMYEPGVFSRYHDFGLTTISAGLVTQFDYAVVPEPSMAGLLVIGVAAAVLRKHRNRKAGA
jgi:hypothetical protein